MKLLRAGFENFRLLRDLEIEFSSKPDRNLTVIRAANESGKTTILHGLQWALYGDGALPGKGEGFRLHPIDWDVSEGKRVPITATVEFELTTYRRTSGGMRETRWRYRLVRSTFEDVDSQAHRSASTVRLFALNETGASPIDAPESLINDELPPELREVFFTDGDRALSFIEADVALSTKRGRVQRAIRSSSRARRDRRCNQACAQVGGGSEQEGKTGRRRQRTEHNRYAPRSDGKQPRGIGKPTLWTRNSNSEPSTKRLTKSTARSLWSSNRATRRSCVGTSTTYVRESGISTANFRHRSRNTQRCFAAVPLQPTCSRPC